MQLCIISGSVHTCTAPLQIRGEISVLITATAETQKGAGGAVFLLVLKQPTSSDFSERVLERVLFFFSFKLKKGKLVLVFIPLPEQR